MAVEKPNLGKTLIDNTNCPVPDPGEELCDAWVGGGGVEVVFPGQELQDAHQVRLQRGVVHQLRPTAASGGVLSGV